MIAFGPVPSRRLGQSMGINNIPPKICTYSCIYCQLGHTKRMQVNREKFISMDAIVEDVEKKILNAKSKKEPVDYLCFVPDGEPTLDINLGIEIIRLRNTGIPVAVITNSSLIGNEDVQYGLMQADWVSLKIDAVSSGIWRRINRPHKSLDLDSMHEGMRHFSKRYGGRLVTETMLVEDVNNDAGELRAIADFISSLDPVASYISVPIRPPADKKVRSPDEASVNTAFQIFSDKLPRVEYLIGYEGSGFAFTGDIEEDILSITAVHPMREDGVRALLLKSGKGWDVVERMIRENKLIATEYCGNTFYTRKIPT